MSDHLARIAAARQDLDAANQTAQDSLRILRLEILAAVRAGLGRGDICNAARYLSYQTVDFACMKVNDKKRSAR